MAHSNLLKLLRYALKTGLGKLVYQEICLCLFMPDFSGNNDWTGNQKLSGSCAHPICSAVSVLRLHREGSFFKLGTAVTRQAESWQTNGLKATPLLKAYDRRAKASSDNPADDLKQVPAKG